MEGSVKRLKITKKPCLLNLDQFLPIKELRKMILRKLTKFDMEIVWMAHGSNMEIVWMDGRKLNKYKHSQRYLDNSFCVGSAIHGYLDLMIWKMKQLSFEDKFDMIGNCFYHAIDHEQVHVAEYLLNKYKICRKQKKLSKFDYCEYALRTKKYKAFQWLRQKGFPYDDYLCNDLVERGYLLGLHLAIECGCRYKKRELLSTATFYNNFEIFQYLNSL